MMIMRWRNVQTNEYDLQVITYPTICTHHKLHNNDENISGMDVNIIITILGYTTPVSWMC